MAWVTDHDLTYRGDFPLNTAGGQLSFGQAGMAGGMHHVVDGARQIMGRAGDAQVPDCHNAFVTGNGGIMSEQVALLMRGDLAMSRAGDDAVGAPPACGGRSDEVGARPTSGRYPHPLAGESGANERRTSPRPRTHAGVAALSGTAWHSTGSWCSTRLRCSATCSIRVPSPQAHWPTTWNGAK